MRLIPCAVAGWAAAAVALGARPAAGAVGAVCCAVTGVALLAAAPARRVLAGVARRPARGRRAEPLRGGPGPAPDLPGGGAVAPGRWSARPGSARVAAAGVLLCASAAAGSAALHAADLYRGPLPGLARQAAQVTVEAEVTGDPRLTRPRVNGPRTVPPVVVVAGEARRILGPDGTVTDIRTPVLVVAPRPADDRPAARERQAWLRLLPTTRLRLRARVVPPLGGVDRTAAVLRVTGSGGPVVIGEPTAVQRAAGELRAGLRQASDGLSPDARALLPGLVVGDTSRVPADLDRVFDATELVHLLSVSGANLTIVLALLIGPPHLAVRAERRGLAPRFGISLRGTAVLGGALTLAFVVVCRPEPSVLRAAACGGITLLAIATGRRRSLLPALAAAVLLLVLYDPWLARSYGFLLSVSATGALLTLAPRWSAALQRRGVPPRVAEVLAAAAAAQAVCAPVVAVLASRVSLVAIPCNLLAEVAVAPATILGFAALATATWAMPAAEALAWLAGWPVEWIATVARAGAALPGAEMEWPDGWTGGVLLVLLTVVLVPVAGLLARRPWVCGVCVLVLLAVVFRPAPLPRFVTGWPPPDWRMAVCDVGQGDALVLAAGGDRAVVVDAGPEPEAVDRCLRDLGVRSVPLLVLTHFHADHVSGLPGLLRGRSVGAIETTTLEEPPGQAAFVRRTASAAGVEVLRSTPGPRRLGPLDWQVLWPLPGRAAGGGANDASVTMLVRTGGLTLLLLGDLEPLAQQRLASTAGLPPVDVLKVAHHGSAYQDPGLLARLRPRIALISCGADNSYGHPAPRTVAALRAGGAVVLRTDRDGSIAVTGPRARPAAVVAGRRADSPGRAGARGRRNPRGRSGPGQRNPRGRRDSRGRRGPCPRGGRSPTRTPASRRTRRPARAGPPGPGRWPRPPEPPATGRPRRRPHRRAPPGRPRAPFRGRTGRPPRQPPPRPPPGPAAPADGGARRREGPAPGHRPVRRRPRGVFRSYAHCAGRGGGTRTAECVQGPGRPVRHRSPAVGVPWDAGRRWPGRRPPTICSPLSPSPWARRNFSWSARCER
ncbi:MBL fold metallo-hydrolase [Streptomyces sp. PLAI1-29]|uniref:MBL fold metallo-hydrolase n=1 Tax=Streptomyces zingiberis TaxID=2053010 RepID=A0ABX1BNY2_9ACTN|nr:MBL fold metallo-hydrolase [Streptomyces zingiberis]